MSNIIIIPIERLLDEKRLDKWVAINAWNRVKDLHISKKEKCKYVRRHIMLARERRKKNGNTGRHKQCGQR